MCITTMAKQKLFKPTLLPRKCTWGKWYQSSPKTDFFSFVSNRSDGFNLMIKIKTYVYTYGGLFSSKLQVINSKIQLSGVNPPHVAKHALSVYDWPYLQFPTFGKCYLTANKRNSNVDHFKRSLIQV